MDEPCTKYGPGNAEPLHRLFEACPDCGHNIVAHPGPLNPGLQSCALCMLVQAAAHQDNLRPS
jgi:hypothetical protein